MNLYARGFSGGIVTCNQCGYRTNVFPVLIDYGLWEPGENGSSYRIRNFEARQELRLVTDAKRSMHSNMGQKGNCIRWHGPDCDCWKEAQ